MHRGFEGSDTPPRQARDHEYPLSTLCCANACRARDQGSQFTSIGFIKTLKDADIQISMDGNGAWLDNVFVERLWRTIKYEEVYLRAYDSVSAARESLARYLSFYYKRRPHSSLDGQTPDQEYLSPSSPIPVAA